MRISEKIHCITQQFSVTEKIKRSVNIYVLEGNGIYLIDSGVKGSLVIIEEYLKGIGRKIEEINGIFLTHTHPDHIGGIFELRKRADFKLYCSNEEKNWIENIDTQFKERPIPGFYNLVGGSAKVDKEVCNGDLIEVEKNINLKVIATPGHSGGSLSFYFVEEKALFTGDAVPTIENLSMPIYTSYKKSINSIKELKNIENVNYLLSAWDIPKCKDEVYIALNQGEEILNKINAAAIKNIADYSKDKQEEFVTKVFEELKIEKGIINPLVIISLISNVEENQLK